MAAPSRGLYIFVSICCFLVIPLGLLAPKVGPKLMDAWRWRKLGRPLGAHGRLVGYVVSSGYGEDSVLLDLSGKELRRWPTGNDCYGLDCLSNGNVLFGGQGRVCEFDRDGKEVWRLPDAARLDRVTDVQRLANGNTLVVSSGGNFLVREFTPAGAEVWRYQPDGFASVYSARRLADGKTLVPVDLSGQPPGRLLEVAPDGKVVRQVDLPSLSFCARRLANGNTLLADTTSNQVLEFDPAGREVWSWRNHSSASAERLPDGRTLVGQVNPSRVLLVSPDGKEEILYTGPAAGRACPVYAGR
jgi:hypothetical protein